MFEFEDIPFCDWNKQEQEFLIGMICELAGGLYSWRQPKSNKLHGGVRKQLSTASPPPRIFDCVY